MASTASGTYLDGADNDDEISSANEIYVGQRATKQPRVNGQDITQPMNPARKEKKLTFRQRLTVLHRRWHGWEDTLSYGQKAVVDFCELAAWISISPALIPYYIIQMKIHDRNDRKAGLHDVPPFVRPLLLQPRERSLTLPLEKPTRIRGLHGKQQSLSQDQSQFFRTLPPELRSLVYKFVLREQSGTCHVYITDHNREEFILQHFAYTHCRQPSDDLDHHGCWKAVINNSRYLHRRAFSNRYDGIHCFMPPTTPRSTSIRLALLCACRRVYSEAIDILYMANTFSFLDIPEWMFFPRAIIPHRFRAIRSLHLQTRLVYRFDYHGLPPPPDDYSLESLPSQPLNRVCLKVASMPNLNDLRWVLSIKWENTRAVVPQNTAEMSVSREWAILKELSQITGPGKFVVVVSWDDVGGDLEGKVPFEIVRRAVEIPSMPRLWPHTLVI